MTSTGRAFQLATRALLGAVLLALAIGASSASAATASWSVEPSFYDFGALLPESGPSSPAAFTLTNTGEVELPPPRVFLTSGADEGPEPGPFGFTASDCENRASLAPAESCTAEVTFNPFYPGQRQGSITFTDPTSQVAPASAAFAGRGIGPIVSFSPPMVSMSARVGEGPSPPKILTVTNDGDADLSILGISLLGEDASHFAIVGGSCHPDGSVAPSASCTIQLTFSPTTAGFVFGELQLKDTAAHGTQIAGLQGVGLAPPPARLVPLATFIFERPPKVTKRRFATFRFGVEAGPARFVCELDRGPVHPCSSPRTYRHLALGPHVFRVKPRKRTPGVSPAFSVARFRVVRRGGNSSGP